MGKEATYALPLSALGLCIILGFLLADLALDYPSPRPKIVVTPTYVWTMLRRTSTKLFGYEGVIHNTDGIVADVFPSEDLELMTTKANVVIAGASSTQIPQTDKIQGSSDHKHVRFTKGPARVSSVPFPRSFLVYRYSTDGEHQHTVQDPASGSQMRIHAYHPYKNTMGELPLGGTEGETAQAMKLGSWGNNNLWSFRCKMADGEIGVPMATLTPPAGHENVLTNLRHLRIVKDADVKPSTDSWFFEYDRKQPTSKSFAPNATLYMDDASTKLQCVPTEYFVDRDGGLPHPQLSVAQKTDSVVSRRLSESFLFAVPMSIVLAATVLVVAKRVQEAERLQSRVLHAITVALALPILWGLLAASGLLQDPLTLVLCGEMAAVGLRWRVVLPALVVVMVVLELRAHSVPAPISADREKTE